MAQHDSDSCGNQYFNLTHSSSVGQLEGYLALLPQSITAVWRTPVVVIFEALEVPDTSEAREEDMADDVISFISMKDNDNTTLHTNSVLKKDLRIFYMRDKPMLCSEQLAAMISRFMTMPISKMP